MPSSFLIHQLADKIDDLCEAFFAAQEGLEEGSFFDATRPRLDAGHAAGTDPLRAFEVGACQE